MRLLAIDPGNKLTAYCLMDENYRPICKDKVENADALEFITAHAVEIDQIAVEMIASYGMAVGSEVFETCVMVGKIEQLAQMLGIPVERVFRMEEKQFICHDSRAKDANIRRALIDRFAKHDLARGTGTRNNPDWFYGFKSDIWAAFAVGVVFFDKRRMKGAVWNG